MRAWISIVLLVASLSSAGAEDVFVSSLRLRGGYDSNPLLAPNAKGAAFATLEGALAAGRNNDGWVTGVTAEFSATKFSEPAFHAFQNHRLRLRLSNENIGGFSLDSTTAFAAASNYDTRVASAAHRAHVQYAQGKVRPFAAGELRLAALNELNPLLGDFLPEPMRFLRGTIAPGVAYVEGKNEIGVSVTAGRTKFEGEADLFGFHRSHNRVQPALFAKFERDGFSLRGSISYFRAYSEDAFFTDVSHLLFDAGASANWGPGWSADVSLSQAAEETTFPVSPMTINRLFQAKLTRSLDEKASVGIFARRLRRDYWDTPLYSITRTAGVELSYALSPEISLTGEFAVSRATLLSGDDADGVVATLGLTRRFNAQETK